MTRNKKSRFGGLMVLVLATVFLLGLVIGMLIIHFADSQNKTGKEDEDTSVQTELPPEEIKNVTNVYIPKRERVFGQIPINSYNTENFAIEEGYMTYRNESGEKISHLGLDLSYHNEMINWDELALSDAEFVMLRCGYRGYTEGGLVKDEKFEEYASEANRVGLNLGVYFFTQAITVEEAKAEADFVIDLIKDYQISYPVAIDTEYVTEKNARTNINEISDELRSEMLIAFCERIREAGYYPMIYASENWIRRNMDLEMLSDYDFWAAQYLEENDFMYDFTIWQYTESGSIRGISENVDLNISMVDYAQFVPALREAVLTEGEIVTIDDGNDTDERDESLKDI